MTEPASRLERIVRSGRFCVTAEVVPPRSADGSSVEAQARALVGYADAANVTDNPTASAHMSPLAGAAILARAGLEPTLQITCRDRNRLGLTSDLLGAWALGARNLFCLTGDPVAIGDHPEASVVGDLSVVELVHLAAGLREEGRLLSGARIDPPPRFFIGVADLPLAEPYDPARLEAKLDAGAHFVMTQIVYDLDAFGAWAEGARTRGLFERAAVIAGVAPLRSASQARYVNDHLPGVAVPPAVVRALEEAGPDAEAEGVRLTIELVARLREIGGLAGVHVMGMGREEAVRHVIEGANLLPRPTGVA
ncbi:MAG TPA: methylenetetrahydrofolate reductase [Actinomycetota bacterium]|nr:methylenetetrahydrofolate reductase [Actinomycetota bacterium]